ncbi:MAG: hypothetical protein V4557_04810 [Bacteroidota bacterium]
MSKVSVFDFLVKNIGRVCLMGFGLLMFIQCLSDLFSARRESAIPIYLVSLVIIGFCLIAGYSYLAKAYSKAQPTSTALQENNDPFRTSKPIPAPKQDGMYYGIIVSEQLPKMPIGLILVFKRNRVFKHFVHPTKLKFYTAAENRNDLYNELTNTGIYNHQPAFTGLCLVEGPSCRISFDVKDEKFHGVGLMYENGIDLHFVTIDDSGKTTLNGKSPLFYRRCT